MIVSSLHLGLPATTVQTSMAEGHCYMTAAEGRCYMAATEGRCYMMATGDGVCVSA